MILDGGGARDVVRFINSSPGAGRPVVFEGLTFANGSSAIAGIGGAVTLQNASATFRNCLFQNNVASSTQTGGGALSLATSTAFFFDCVWTGNSAKFYGGALAVETLSRAYIHRGSFTSNRTNLPNHLPVSGGGAIHVGDSLLRVSNSRFDSNQAGYVGGAIYAIGTWATPVTTPSSDVLVSDCTFINNQALRDASVTFGAPTEGGAFHAEDQTTAKIYNSRFITNSAHTGGGINLYRAIVEVRGCILQGNRATGAGAANGFGGGISAISNDGADATTNSGTINRRTSNLLVADTLIQGRYGAVTTVGETGGGIYVSGDSNSLYGQNGMPQNGTAASNRATASLTNVLLVDCDVQETSGASGTGIGGGLEADLATLTISGSLVANCDAVTGGGASNAAGGGLSIINQSAATITSSTIAKCTAAQYGGGVFAQGSTLNITGCNFIQNEVSPGFAETSNVSYGAALFTTPAIPTATSMTGTVASCVFTENVGLTIFDDDRSPGPINDMRYNSNQFFATTFGTTIYWDSVACCGRTAAALNTLTVTRGAGQSTQKSSAANTALGSRPSIGVLRAAPASVVALGAVGDSSAPAAWLGFAWSGTSASLDGASPGSAAGIAVTAAGSHTLVVDGGSTPVTITGAAMPAASLSASPASVAAGTSTTLSWSSAAGTFLDAAIDRGAAASAGASGSVAASVPGTLLFSLYEIFQEGAVVATAPVAGTGTLPSISSFSASPVLVNPGGFSLLNWSTAGGTSVLVNGATASPSANMGVTPAVTTTYPLVVMNSAGKASRSVTVNVNSGSAALGIPTISTPIAGGTYNAAGVSFSWSSAGGSSGYDLRLFDAQTGGVLFSGSLAGAGSTSTLISLGNGGYTFAVRACNGGGFADGNCGKFSSQSFTVALTAPAGTPSVTSPGAGASLTTSTQTLSWSSVAKADPAQPLFYEVLLLDLATVATELQITVPDPQLSTIYSMHSSTSFELRVRACQAGCGPYSSPLRFSVALPAVPSVAPTITGATVTGGNSLAVTWTGVTGADSYQVQMIQPAGGPGGGALTVAARQVSGNNVTLSVPAGFANVIVAGCNGDGCGPFSSPASVTPAGPNPTAPVVGTPIAGTVVNGPGVNFSWSRIPGDTGGTTYRLYVQDLSRQSAALDVYTTQNFWAAALKAEGSRYDVLVVANPGASQIVGPSAGFNLRGVSATAPTMVAPAHQSTVPSGNIQLSWSPVPNATLYEYFVAVQGQPNASAIGVTPGLLLQVPLNGSPTTYSAIARACPAGNTCSIVSDAGWGPWSNAPGGPGVTNFTVTP
ncbi:MAG: hypothetical protein ABI682_15705 [Acidobacteriota bacterium]